MIGFERVTKLSKFESIKESLGWRTGVARTVKRLEFLVTAWSRLPPAKEEWCLGASVPRWCLCPQTLPIPAGIISKHVNYPQQKLKQTKHFFHFQETIWAWSINWTNLRATTSSYQYIKKKYINSSANERMKCGKNGWMTLVIVWLDLTW